MTINLASDAAGNLRIIPRGALPRLERAFSRSVGAGMLDLLRFGIPVGATPIFSWLSSKAHDYLARYLQAIRRGEAPPTLPSAEQQYADMLESMPPLYGSEIGVGALKTWLASLLPALEEQASQENITPEAWLCQLGEGWKQLGALCFHLAENAGENANDYPFAFLATFIHKVGQDGQPKHAPLGLAAQLHADNRSALLDLLRPLQRLAAKSRFFSELINTRAIYAPCAWNARQAYEFLESQPLLDQEGIETHIVNLWKTLPPRIELEVKVETQGNAKPDQSPALNINSLLHFIPQVAMGMHHLTEDELKALLAGDDGLIRFRGEWVRLDQDRLQRLLNSWRQASRMAAGGIPLLTGLRYLLGKRREALPHLPPLEDGMRLTMGENLAHALSKLQLGQQAPDLPPDLSNTLRRYQHDGVRFLLNVTNAGFGACLADDMGLGKTLQVIAWLTHLQRVGELEKSAALIIAPASLISNWQQELNRFAPQLAIVVLHPYALTPPERSALNATPEGLLKKAHVALTTYGIAGKNERLAQYAFSALILDEAQAIKNAASQRTRAILRYASPRRVALTGTPVENTLSELRSLFEFLTPGLLGSEQQFNALVKDMGHDYAPLRRLIRPFILRRLKSDPGLLPELPPKTEQPAYCLLTPEQTQLYANEVENLRAVLSEPDPQTRLNLVLPILSRFKQICNHPAQYLGQTYFDPEKSGKMMYLSHLAKRIAAAGDCCLVFTQYRSMVEPLHDYLTDIFGSPGLILHGGLPIGERQQRIKQFQSPDGPRFFILSLKAAGTGLTLTRARHVIHFDRWWNPAIENQASDRAYRLGQKQPVVIHPFISRGTIEENIHNMLKRKSSMAQNLLSGGLEKLLLHLAPEDILALAQQPSSLTSAPY